MEQLIGRLIEIDKQARARVSKAKKERAKALETVDERRKEMEQSYQDALDTLIAEEQKRAEDAREAALSEIEENKRSLVSGLDALYEANADRWVDAIVERVLND